MSAQIPALLTVCGLDELEGHGTRGVTHVLSILDPGQPDPDFGRYPPHTRTLLRFHDIIDPMPGMIMPTLDDMRAILAFGRAIAEDGEASAHLLVHCHAGISRSTAAMAAILAQAQPDMTETAVVERIFAIREKAWPNSVMIGFADDLLGRGGRLTEAANELYRRHLVRRPELGPLMTGLGRAREVAIGLDRARPAAG